MKPSAGRHTQGKPFTIVRWLIAAAIIGFIQLPSIANAQPVTPAQAIEEGLRRQVERTQDLQQRLAPETVTIVITPDAASGKASISAHRQYYQNSANCDAATLDTDFTFPGTASDKAGSKNYTNAAGKPVTAKVATIAYSGFTLSRGNLKLSLPAPCATTDMAYVLDNNTLYLSKGHREADGLGDSLILGAVKQ